MHVYIYDSYVNQRKFEKEITKLEIRVTDLGLGGKIIRLGTMNSLYSTIESEIKKAAKTIIAVGDNNILNQSINAIAKLKIQNKYNSNTPLAFIPIGKKNNNIAKLFGIHDVEGACNSLSGRRIKTIDLGLANSEHFLTEAEIATKNTNIKIDSNYSIEILKNGKIRIINIPLVSDLPVKIKAKADDGVLELFIKTKESAFINNDEEGSVISFKKLEIMNPSEAVLLDSSIKVSTPVSVSIAKEKIDMIVGRERVF